MLIMLGTGFSLLSDSCNSGSADAYDARLALPSHSLNTGAGVGGATLRQLQQWRLMLMILGAGTAAALGLLMLMMLGAGFSLLSDSWHWGC